MIEEHFLAGGFNPLSCGAFTATGTDVKPYCWTLSMRFNPLSCGAFTATWTHLRRSEHGEMIVSIPFHAGPSLRREFVATCVHDWMPGFNPLSCGAFTAT